MRFYCTVCRGIDSPCTDVPLHRQFTRTMSFCSGKNKSPTDKGQENVNSTNAKAAQRDDQ